MNLNKKWATTVGAVLISGALLTGAAFAASDPGQAPAPAGHQALTPGQQEVHQQLRALRKSAKDKLRADSQAVIEQAARDGKISQEQANQLKEHLAKKGRHMRHGNHGLGKLTKEQLQSKLDEKVKDGKLTPDQANKIIERWSEHHRQSN